MRLRMILVVAILVGCTHTDLIPQRVLPLEPILVTLTGSVQKREYPGPPDYTMETPDDVCILILERPVSVNLSKSSSEPRRIIRVIEIQIVLPSKMDRQVVLNHRVEATGTLFTRFTAHHHTSVLMMAENIKVLAGSPIEW